MVTQRTGSRQHGQTVGGSGDVLLQLFAFRLVATVLKPNLDLSLAQLQHGRQFASFRTAQILLALEASLQFEHLSMRERGPSALLASAAHQMQMRAMMR
jgi:hypothetical protein